MTALHPDFLRLPLAHRGLHDRDAGRIENSRAAVSAATEAGYGIEIDVQLTADNVAVVFHDAYLDRLTGETGSVRARTLTQLQQVPLTGTTEVIPSLTEVLSLVDGQTPLLVELKDQSGGLGPEPDTLAAAVASAIEGYSGPLALMSYNPHIVQHLSRLVPDTPRGLTTEDFTDAPGLTAEQKRHLNEIDTFDAVGAMFVSHDFEHLESPALARLRARGVPILTWTIRSAEEARATRLLSDNITFEDFYPPVPLPEG